MGFTVYRNSNSFKGKSITNFSISISLYILLGFYFADQLICNVILISTGQIVSELHYGPNCHNWWLLRPTDKTNNPALLYPI